MPSTRERLQSIDPVGNRVDVSYDDNDNPVKVVETEKYPDGSTRTYETYRIFDSVNRVTSATDNVGLTYRYAYDSRDNLVSTTDPNGPVTTGFINGRPVNDAGKQRTFAHDGLNRLTKETLVGGADSQKYPFTGRGTASPRSPLFQSSFAPSSRSG